MTAILLTMLYLQQNDIAIDVIFMRIQQSRETVYESKSKREKDKCL